MSQKSVFYRYVLPSMAAFALSGIYAIADGFFVGRALGDDALAAINVAYPMTAVLTSVGTGIGMGGSVEFSIRRGIGDRKAAGSYFGTAAILTLVAGIFLMAAFLAVNDRVIGWFGGEGRVRDYGEEYLLFISLGALFQVGGTAAVPFLRNMGASLAAMLSMCAGFVTNIVLDWLLVWVYPWGMTGVAIASVAGQGVTMLLCLVHFIRLREFPEFHFPNGFFASARRILKIGISPFGLTFSPNLTLILVNKTASLIGGTFAVAVYAPVSYVTCVATLLLQGVSDGAQPLLSYTYGRGEREATRSYRNMSFLFAVVTGIVTAAVAILRRNDFGIWFGASAAVSAEVGRVLPVFAAGFPLLAVSRVATAYFYATEGNREAYVLIYGEAVILLLLVFVLPPLTGTAGLWASVPVAQGVTALLSVIFVRYAGKHAPTALRE